MKNPQELNSNQMFKLYNLAEMAYEKHFENNFANKEYLYPEGWYSKQNYKLKIEIIAEAIKNNVIIENTSKYQETIEGVKKIKISK